MLPILGTTLSGKVALLPAGQVFVTTDEHGFPVPMACVADRLAPVAQEPVLTRAIVCRNPSDRLELLNTAECEAEYTFPLFRPDTEVQVFVVDTREDQEFARIVGPVVFGVRYHDKEAMHDLLRLVYMTTADSDKFSLRFAEAFRERIFGHHAVRHGITIPQLLAHFGLSPRRKEAFKKAKQNLGLTQKSAAEDKSLSVAEQASVPPPSGISTLAPKTAPFSHPPSNAGSALDDTRGSSATAPSGMPAQSHEEALSPEEQLALAWDQHLSPRGYPSLADALLVAEYYKGDIKRHQLTHDCVRCLAESMQDADRFAGGINNLFGTYNANLQDAEGVSQALFFYEGRRMMAAETQRTCSGCVTPAWFETSE